MVTVLYMWLSRKSVNVLLVASYTLFKEDELFSDEDDTSLLEELSTDEDDFLSLEELSSDEDKTPLLEELSTDEDDFLPLEEESLNDEDIILLEELNLSIDELDSSISGLTKGPLESSSPQDEKKYKRTNNMIKNLYIEVSFIAVSPYGLCNLYGLSHRQ